MSEPSPEAKQAELLPCPFCGNRAVTEFEYEKCTYMTQCESCGAGTCASSDKDETIKDWNSRSDTATAKLREEYEQTRRERDAVNEDYHHLQIDHDKAREEYEEVLTDHRRLVRELDVALNGGGAARQASLCDIVAQVRQLAHQPLDSAQDEQPSAPTVTSVRHKCGYFISPQSVICNHCGEAASAPTADVEKWKISGDGLSVFVGNTFLFRARDKVEALVAVERHNKALAQVSAPLVEALRKIADSHSQLFPMQLRAIAHNALQAAAHTDTGEKKWQQALDQQQQTNVEIVETVTKAKGINETNSNDTSSNFTT